MYKELEIDKRVTLYGRKKKVEEFEQTLIQQGYPKDLSEANARLHLQGLMDNQFPKIEIMFSGNSVWSYKKVIRDFKKLQKEGMNQLSDYLYEFFSLSCGSIAHYDRQGWISTYPTISDLKQFFTRNEMGNRVLDYLPDWKTDVKRIVTEIEKLLKI